jgi:hypothetical protein
MKTVILVDRHDEQRVLEEEKQGWLRRVLVALGMTEDLLDSDDLRSHLAVAELEVWHGSDGSVDILRRNKLVAQWSSPKFVLVKDSSGKTYYELHLNEWALPFQMHKKGE